MVLSVSLADAECLDLGDIVNTDRYPLHDPDSPRLNELVAACSAVLHDFLRPQALERARNEGRALAAKTTFQPVRSTPTLPPTTPRCPMRDPRRIFMDRISGFVTRDLIPADAIVHRVYVAEAMKRFVANCSRIIRARIRPGCWPDPRTRRIMNIDNAGSPSGALNASRSRIGFAARNNPHILMTSITVFFLSLN